MQQTPSFPRVRNLLRLLPAVSLLLLLPLIGVLLSGQPIGRYLEFPPLTHYVQHAAFSRPVFLLGCFFGGMVILFVFSFRAEKKVCPVCESPFSFPWWGKLGLLLIVLFWVLAWTRFSWFSTFQAWTFTPIWFGYILTVNGLSVYRQRCCLLLTAPKSFALLFPVSAFFWWYFEYLNRFVQNWYYVGVDDFSGQAYIFHATLCFSTVLPAVVSTIEFLTTAEGLRGRFAHGPRVQVHIGKQSGWWLLLCMGCVLVSLPVVPDLLFPFVWMAPALILFAFQTLRGQQSLFSSLTEGDWRPILFPAIAALVCGFFWELWNWKSLAHWEYSIPYVDRYHLFAMPILGYLGYLPFGLECQLMASECGCPSWDD